MGEETDRYILDEHGDPQPCEDLLEWGRWLQTHPRHVAQDMDEGDEHGLRVRVSTIFIGVDMSINPEPHPPVLWETMVFGGLLSYQMERYTSAAAALAGHQRWCARVRESLK